LNPGIFNIMMPVGVQSTEQSVGIIVGAFDPNIFRKLQFP